MVDSDLPIGFDGLVRSLTIEVRSDGPLGARRDRRVWPALASPIPIRLPMTFSLTPEDQDNAQTVWVEVNACPGDGECGEGRAVAALVTQRAIVTYLPHVLADLRLFLAASCRGVMCSAVQTCAPDTGRCRAAELRVAGVQTRDAATDLASRPDAARDAGIDGVSLLEDGGCPNELTPCEGWCVSLSSVEHCGACGVRCPSDTANASPACVMGACRFRCAPSHQDCDGVAENGCESERASDPAHCGRCRNACTADGGEARCMGGACTTLTCPPGFADCNQRASDGCEVDLSRNAGHCGVCEFACSGRLRDAMDFACVQGMCRTIRCRAGYADCDRVPANGCETDLSTAANCGSCGTRCRSGRSCLSGRCECRVGDVACMHEDVDGG